mmetsp:Transcript_90439/g.165976  ORF Transcript_90439/g.165976 Transcript_90439/m.165976 type:complete len:243 (+) Transcript_90439:380-1108(+)
MPPRHTGPPPLARVPSLPKVETVRNPGRRARQQSSGRKRIRQSSGRMLQKETGQQISACMSMRPADRQDRGGKMVLTGGMPGRKITRKRGRMIGKRIAVQRRQTSGKKITRPMVGNIESIESIVCSGKTITTGTAKVMNPTVLPGRIRGRTMMNSTALPRDSQKRQRRPEGREKNQGWWYSTTICRARKCSACLHQAGALGFILQAAWDSPVSSMTAYCQSSWPLSRRQVHKCMSHSPTIQR